MKLIEPKMWYSREWFEMCKAKYSTIREKVFNLEVSNLWRKSKLSYRNLKKAEKYYKEQIEKCKSYEIN